MYFCTLAFVLFVFFVLSLLQLITRGRQLIGIKLRTIIILLQKSSENSTKPWTRFGYSILWFLIFLLYEFKYSLFEFIFLDKLFLLKLYKQLNVRTHKLVFFSIFWMSCNLGPRGNCLSNRLVGNYVFCFCFWK